MNTMPQTGITMISKYKGVCAGCAESFAAGDSIQYFGKGETYHFDCRPRGMEPAQQILTQDGYIFNDTETGGLNPKTDALVQIAGIAVSENLVYISTFQSYINPPEHLLIGERSIEVHGRTRASLVNEPSEREVLIAWAEWCLKHKNFRFAGFNTPFDLKFMDEAYRRCDIDPRLLYQLPSFDVYPLAVKKLGNKTPNHKLVTVAKHLGLETKGAHNALVDLFQTVGSARELRKIG